MIFILKNLLVIIYFVYDNLISLVKTYHMDDNYFEFFINDNLFHIL